MLSDSFKKTTDFFLLGHRGFCGGAKVQYVWDVRCTSFIQSLNSHGESCGSLSFQSSPLTKTANISAVKLFQEESWTSLF